MERYNPSQTARRHRFQRNDQERIFMPPLRVGVVGLGGISQSHLKAILKLSDLQLVGLADNSGTAREARSREYNLPAFPSHLDLIEATRPDYVVIGTPHYSHTEIAMDAMRRGVHAFLEKPMAVSAARAEECVAVARQTGRVLGVNFLRRLQPAERKLHDLIQSGFLGRPLRVTMICTSWFRSMAYYRSSPWRATWSGEGGGVTVNQSPHDLDLLIWAVGLPSEVFAELNTSGHDIEVEDDVVGAMKWPGGATGTIHVTTNEAPGRTFLEIAGTRGTLTLERNKIKATQLADDSAEFSRTTAGMWSSPAVQSSVTYELPDTADGFMLMHRNFAEAIRKGEPLVCTGEEGVREVELANALLVSSVKRQWVSTSEAPKEFDAVLAKLLEVKKLDAAKAHFKKHV
jgi:predicted dehydrogenase